MGGELYAELFVGPDETHNVYNWMIILKIFTKEEILEKIRNSENYKNYLGNDDEDEDDDYIISEWGDIYVDKYTKPFFKFLDENKLELVCLHNCNDRGFKIGRVIKDIKDVKDDDSVFWKKYNINHVKIFAGMIGDFDYSTNPLEN